MAAVDQKRITNIMTTLLQKNNFDYIDLSRLSCHLKSDSAMMKDAIRRLYDQPFKKRDILNVIANFNSEEKARSVNGHLRSLLRNLVKAGVIVILVREENKTKGYTYMNAEFYIGDADGTKS